MGPKLAGLVLTRTVTDFLKENVSLSAKSQDSRGAQMTIVRRSCNCDGDGGRCAMTSKVLDLLLPAHPVRASRGQDHKTEKAAGSWVRRVGREPFVHFALLGLLLWFGSEFWHSDQGRYVIYSGPEQRQRLSTNYERQFGQAPTELQIQGMADSYVRDEIYFREALALGLDQDDEIIRRRLLQKYEFLRTDLTVPEAPDVVTLEKWYEKNKSKYTIPARVAFSHVYFSVDTQGEEAARLRASDASTALMRTQLTRAPDRGDAFPGPTDVSDVSVEEANRLFGQSNLTDELFKLPPGQWSGPFRSGYGWHLVYVTHRLPPDVPPFEQIQEQVRADYRDEQRNLLNARGFETLRSKYTVVHQDAPK
jgi:hypothetical protein